MPNPQTCIVTYKGSGPDRKIEVTASSLNEAACLAIRALKSDPLAPVDQMLGFLEIEVKPPTVKHLVRIEQVIAYTRSMGRPNEQAERARLRALLES